MKTTKKTAPKATKKTTKLNDYTHVSVVLDRSGSMQSCWKDTIDSLAKLVADQKKIQGKCTFSLAAFDDKYELLFDFVDIQQVGIESLNIRPRGNTALYDAMGKTVNAVAEKINKLAVADRPTKTLFVIQTDGEENCSREYTHESVKDLINNNLDYDFLFVGATQESVMEAQKCGINAGNTLQYGAACTINTVDMLSNKLGTYRTCCDTNAAKSSLLYTEDERQKSIGVTTTNNP